MKTDCEQNICIDAQNQIFVQLVWAWAVITISIRGGGAAAPQAWKSSGQTLFSRQAQVAQNPERWKNFQYSVYANWNACKG